MRDSGGVFPSAFAADGLFARRVAMCGHLEPRLASTLRGCLVGMASALLLGTPRSGAVDERVEDLSASVEVASVSGLHVSGSNLAFADVSSGTTKVLGEGSFFNEIRCRSNAGRPWYLKAHLLSLRNIGSNSDLPPSSLKWAVVDMVGSAEPVGGRQHFQEFSDSPALMYASLGDDHRGREVVLKLQYSLSIPVTALAGSYAGQIIFTMTESP